MDARTPPLTSRNAVESLKPRTAPYWNTLEYCRHVGVQRHPQFGDFWVARARKLSGGHYIQRRLARVDFGGKDGCDYAEALRHARAWFALPEIEEIAARPYPVGVNRQLKYEKKVEGFTIGDAMRDYVEWKRVAAAKTHFETNLSLINCHIIPRLGDVKAKDLNARRVTGFAIDVLETPPVRGRKPLDPRRRLADMDAELLRK
jgi:hypothetical protein